MPIVEPVPIPAAPPAPQRNDPATFEERADAYYAWQSEDLPDGIDAQAAATYENAQDAHASALAAAADREQTGLDRAQTGLDRTAVQNLWTQIEPLKEDIELVSENATEISTVAANIESINVAAGLSNFKGRWADLTGPLTIPAIVLHTGKYWNLLENLGDVALSEPGVTSDWAAIPGSFEPGDILLSARPLPAPEWLPCDGQQYLKSAYPLLAGLMPAAFGAFDLFDIGAGVQAINAVATDGKGVWVVVAAQGLAFRSADNGATWSAISVQFGTTAIRGVATDGSGTWIAVGGSNSPLSSRSTDNGLTWELVDTGLSGGIGCIATDGAGTWVVGSSGGALHRSTDNGVTWVSVTSGTTFTINAIATDGAGLWFAASGSASDVRIVRGTNNGSSWSQIDTGLEANNGSAVGTDGAGAWLIGSAPSSGFVPVVRSPHNGLPNSWGSTPGSLLGRVRSIAADKKGQWVMVGDNGWCLISLDGGASFNSFLSGFGTSNILGVATDGNGTWIIVGQAGRAARSAPSETLFRVPEHRTIAALKAYVYTGEQA